MYDIGDHTAAIDRTLDLWEREGRVRRLWERDASLWTGADEGSWLGWLSALDAHAREWDGIQQFAEVLWREDIPDVMLLGMGGSSLCPDVLGRTFGRLSDRPQLRVLDSTCPGQVWQAEQQVDLARTLFIVASKSGSTTEPTAFCDYFYDRLCAVAGDDAGRQFAAITDPGSQLEARAIADRFRHVFAGVPDIGGRFSALSNFGLVPAGLMGLDVPEFVGRASRMAEECGPDVPAPDNPGVLLGVVLGELAREGRDKVTLVVSPGIEALGAWIEQLLAESTGKLGVGLVPIDREPVAEADRYGQDRVFVYVRLASGVDEAQDIFVSSLRQSGQPVMTIPVPDPMSLGAEFFRWEMATAVAGAVMGINPFDQPDVQESKDFTARLTAVFESDGRLPSSDPIGIFGSVEVYAAGNTADAVSGARTLDELVRSHVGTARRGDYVALCGFIDMVEGFKEPLQGIRRHLLERRGLATTLGFGPRFLHSTGQLHKGGADNGVFVHFTAEDARDVPLPGRRLTFAALKDAQALGDFEALGSRGRRAVRLHLRGDIRQGLDAVEAAVASALR